MYDTYNLRNNANFEVFVAPEVFWIPHNTLGKTKYNFNDLQLIYKETLMGYKKVTNPYELAQFIQANNFKKKLDISFQEQDIFTWEIHRDGQSALQQGYGCCATFSGLFSCFLKEYFEEIYNFCIVSDSGWGHALNIIKYKKYYYFFDLSSQINEHKNYVPIETGRKTDFLKTKFITGGCYKTISIENFINFFLKYLRLSKRHFLFYTTCNTCIPPIAMQQEEIMKIYLKSTDIVNVYEYKQMTNIKAVII